MSGLSEDYIFFRPIKSVAITSKEGSRTPENFMDKIGAKKQPDGRYLLRPCKLITAVGTVSASSTDPQMNSKAPRRASIEDLLRHPEAKQTDECSDHQHDQSQPAGDQGDDQSPERDEE